MPLPTYPHILSARDACIILGISRPTMKRMIAEERIRVVPGAKPLRVIDPRWTTLAGLTFGNIEDSPILRCSEVAELLNLSPRMVRYMAAKGKIRSMVIRKRRLYSLAAVRQAFDDRERGFQGRINSGVRPWVVDWARPRIGTRLDTRH